MQTQEAGTRPRPPLPYPLDENKIGQILVELDEGQQTCVRSVLQCWQHGRLDEDDLLMQMKTLSSKSPTLSALFRKSDIQDARTTEVATADEMQELMTMLGDVNLAQQEIDSRPNSRPGSRPGSRSVSRTSSTHRQYSPVNDPSCLTVPLGGRSSPVFGTGSSSPRRNFAGAAAERRSREKLSSADFDMVENGEDWPRGNSCPRMSATADAQMWGSEFESGREKIVDNGPSSMESSRNFAGAAAERRSREKLSSADFDMVENGEDWPRGNSCPRMSATADAQMWGSEFESGREKIVDNGPSSMESSYASPKRRRWHSRGGWHTHSLNDIYEALPTAQSVERLESEM